jgi:hypothetical protein
VADLDFNPETICGTIIDTHEWAMIEGKTPSEHQIRACQLANASESLLAALHRVVNAKNSHEHEKAMEEAAELLGALPKPLPPS